MFILLRNAGSVHLQCAVPQMDAFYLFFRQGQAQSSDPSQPLKRRASVRKNRRPMLQTPAAGRQAG